MIFETARELGAEIAKQTESKILQQLNEFLKRGLLEIRSTGPSFIHSVLPDGSREMKIEQTIELVLKDQEYIEKLEEDNKNLKVRLMTLKTAVENIDRPIFYPAGTKLTEEDLK